MLWLLLGLAAVAVFLCWLGYENMVGTVIGGISGLYSVAEERLLKCTGDFAAAWDRKKRKLFFIGALLVETIVVIVSFLFSGDKVQWSYSIMSCTPVGGVMSFILDRESFFALGSFSVWIMSGLQFLLQSSYDQEVGKVHDHKYSKPVVFLHSVLFSFFSGTILALGVNDLLLPFVGMLDAGMESAVLVLKILCVVGKLLYYAVGLICLILTVQVFIDNIRMIAVVLSAYGIFFLLYLLVYWVLLGNTGNEATATVLKGMAAAVDAASRLKVDHPILWGIVLLCGVMVIYNAGLMFFKNAVQNAKGAIHDLDVWSHNNDLETTLRISRMSDFQKSVQQRTHKDDYATYLEYKDSPEFQAYLEQLQAKEQQDRLSLAESKERLREILHLDAKKRLMRGQMRKMMRMKPDSLIQKYRFNSGDIHAAEQEIIDFPFAKIRMKAADHPDTSGLFAFFFCMIFFGISMVAVFWATFFSVEQFRLLSDLCMYLAIAELWSILISVIVKVFRKDRSLPLKKTKAIYMVWLIAILLALLSGTQLYKLGSLDELTGFPFQSIGNACLATVAVKNLLYLPVIRKYISKVRPLQNLEIKNHYKQFQKGHCDEVRLPPAETLRQVLYMVLFARAEELKGYMSGTFAAAHGAER